MAVSKIEKFKGFTESQKASAVEMVKESSMREASRRCNVPYTSLRRWCLFGTEKGGRRKIFNDEQEEEIVRLTCHFVKSKKFFLNFVYERSLAWNLKVPSSWRKNKLPGRGWLRSFLERYYVVGLFVRNGTKFLSETAECGNCYDLVFRESVTRICQHCLQAICFNCEQDHGCVIQADHIDS